MSLTERGSAQLKRTLISLRHRNFRLLFWGTSLSHVGDFVQAMAQSWLVWTMTHSPFLLGVIGFCQAVPRLLLGAVGGAIGVMVASWCNDLLGRSIVIGDRAGVEIPLDWTILGFAV
ncbi:MAG TPA: MFS transporter, partial [Candidatus Limnocylindrales bacterium]|nr:MFS transporter [Candidatus Limnocylindrales bacterium]